MLHQMLAVSLAACLSIAAIQAAIPTTTQGALQQVSNPLNTMQYQRGSPDLPMSDPRLEQTVTGVYPEQIHLGYSDPQSMFVSWVTGEAQLSAAVTPLNPNSVQTVVTYGSSPGMYTGNATGYGVVYNQYYNIPAKNNTPAALNYTSGIQHHAQVTGLTPNTTYYYRCGDPSIPAWSAEYNFTTGLPVGPTSFPMTMGVVADLGLTMNSTSTYALPHYKIWKYCQGQHLVENNPPVVVLIGDYVYANNYITNGTGASSFSTSFPGITSQSYQPRWDGFMRWLQPFLQTHPILGIEGNHEQEPDINGTQFQSYLARFQAPGNSSGSNTTLYYSFDMGPAHVVMLGAYVDFGKNSTQYAWLQKDLAKFDRSKTPWLIAMWYQSTLHNLATFFPAYLMELDALTTPLGCVIYKQVECFRQTYEPILYSYGTDLIMHGHVHAYERTNRVYDYNLDSCGPVYITLGDGGNIEQLAVAFADSPGQCTNSSADTCAANFTSGPAAGQFCYNSQPPWSAYREQSFGHGILTFVNQTHALFEWNRNQDTFDEYGDQVYIVRTPQTCPNQYGPAALAAAPTPSASIAALVPASAAKAAGAPGPYATVVSSYGPSSPAGYIAALG